MKRNDDKHHQRMMAVSAMMLPPLVDAESRGFPMPDIGGGGAKRAGKSRRRKYSSSMSLNQKAKRRAGVRAKKARKKNR